MYTCKKSRLLTSMIPDYSIWYTYRVTDIFRTEFLYGIFDKGASMAVKYMSFSSFSSQTVWFCQVKAPENIQRRIYHLQQPSASKHQLIYTWVMTYKQEGRSNVMTRCAGAKERMFSTQTPVILTHFWKWEEWINLWHEHLHNSHVLHGFQGLNKF